MAVVLLMVLMVFNNGVWSNGIGTNVLGRPDVVNIGAVFTFNSTIGKVAKVAIEAAVEDVNLDPTVLAGTQLKLTMQDTNHSRFLGIIEALKFMENDTVAIIGPQSSDTAHVISHILSELQVPLLSFAATDPTLSSQQFPFFVRTTQSDMYQMSAVADIVNYNGWREVIAIYIDDDHGRNGITALGDMLAKKECKISYKAPISTKMSRDDITDVLLKVSSMESRILVLHTYTNWGMNVFQVADHLGMMEPGYVWIATDWLSTVIDSDSPLPLDSMNCIQGVLTFRMYIPDTDPRRKFVGRWSNLTGGKATNASFSLNTYGLYAYDTVWLLARALDNFIDEGGDLSFSNDSRLSELSSASMHFDAMNIFNGGNMLLHKILQVNMTGVTGPVKFNSDGSLVHPAYEVINVIGTGIRKIGYWSNYSGLSVETPERLYSKPPNHQNSSQKLFGVIWPGQTTQRPRGWVFPNNGRHLRIGVFNRVSYREFVSYQEANDMFTGYCIDVFTAALTQIPYSVPYKLIPFGDGQTNPSGNELVNLVTTGEFDAAVGDIAITTNRTKLVDFTQPYIESGLVVVVPVKHLSSNAWAFLRPFTPLMWCVTGISFLIVGAVIWILEHRTNDDFQGPPRKQVVTILWFSFSTLFFAHKQETISSLGRMVLLIWLFVVLILNSNYTANLTSILTVEQLSSPIKGIDSLIAGNDPIGYPHGSFAENYLADELNIHKSRLVPLNTPEEYARALKDGPERGGVSAVVDERAYIELFLATRCDFSIVGREFTKNGWGFAFPRGSSLAVDMSTAILKLSENGDLQKIHDKWLMRSSCSSQESKSEVHRLQLKSFWGLYVVCGLACLLALVLYFIRVLINVNTVFPEDAESADPRPRTTRLQRFISLC